MIRRALKYSFFALLASACLCHAQMALKTADGANDANTISVIDKSAFAYNPVQDYVELAELDEQKSQAKATRSLDAQIPSSLKPPSRNEEVAGKVENAGCAVGTFGDLMGTLVSGGIPVFLGKPTCWQN